MFLTAPGKHTAQIYNLRNVTGRIWTRPGKCRRVGRPRRQQNICTYGGKILTSLQNHDSLQFFKNKEYRRSICHNLSKDSNNTIQGNSRVACLLYVEIFSCIFSLFFDDYFLFRQEICFSILTHNVQSIISQLNHVVSFAAARVNYRQDSIQYNQRCVPFYMISFV